MASSPNRKGAGGEDGVTCSRSGRIRKPKVFYDPSESDPKRRSLPTFEATKTKKPPKTTQNEPATDETKKLSSSLEKVPAKTKPQTVAAAINNRRRTICVPVFDEETGCIVCGRSDTKKGRFVNCIDCIKRGHFTCLRNDKLFKAADQELSWQCPTCKICEYCHVLKPNEELYKCTICLNSYHLQCSDKISPLQKNVSKKKFTCGKCTKPSTTVKTFQPTRQLLVNRKSDGFPGFAHEDTRKVEKKSTVTVNPKQVTKIVSSASVMKDTIPEIKQEEELQSYDDQIQVKKISLRNDLFKIVDDCCSSALDEQDPKNDEKKMDIEYDTKTAITPHDSIPDVRKWDCDEVYMYFTVKTPEYAQLFKDNQIDGDALLLIKREDVLNRFSLKLGPALRVYSHIVALQYKNNNPILAWNEF